MEKYKPVAGAVYEELEWLAAQRSQCDIIFRAGNGGTSVIRGRVVKLYTDNAGASYIALDSGLEIRLDKLVEVNGRKMENYC